MKVTGTVRKIYFRNPKNGFSVFSLATDESSKTVKIVGNVPWEVGLGDKLTAVGEIENTKYGEQLSAAIIEEPQPATAEELEKYLASDLIKGIGQNTHPDSLRNLEKISRMLSKTARKNFYRSKG